MFKLFVGATPVAPIMRPLPRLGSGRRTLRTLHREIERAAARRYDIHKIGAKTRARMARANDAGPR